MRLGSARPGLQAQLAEVASQGPQQGYAECLVGQVLGVWLLGGENWDAGYPGGTAEAEEGLPGKGASEQPR